MRDPRDVDRMLAMLAARFSLPEARELHEIEIQRWDFEAAQRRQRAQERAGDA